MRTKGGKAIYGASVGILMLEAQFPRIKGDMGNALSWPFPVHYKIVRGASPEKVVTNGAVGMLPHFIQAAEELVADGVDGITTNCGFLALFQDELQAAVPVPVATSSLSQVEMVNRVLPRDKCAGILTISASSLSEEHLSKAHVPEDTPIGTTEGGREFTRAILENETEMDIDLAREDNVNAALAMQQANPNLGAIVLECTNMVPYAADIQQATGLPIYSIHSFVSWFQSGLQPPRW
jgi:Asp/Glu/hydantoin racemase